MAIREVLKMGNPVLRQESAIVSKEEILSDEFQQLLTDMSDTMEEQDGIGIAAPQIGVLKQVALVGIPSDNDRYPDAPEFDLLVVINPKIEVLDSALQGNWEGCLSVPGLRGFVERPSKIKVTFLDQEANEQIIEADDFIATVFQHEIDHLFGKLYIDRVTDTTKISFIDEFEHFITKDE